MADYAFETIWRLHAPIDQVYELIEDSLRWPEWWPSVLAVEELEPGDENHLGNVRRYTFKGRLPYLLRFDSRVTVREAPTTLSGDARGELQGTGRWTLSESNGVTTARYNWNIETTRWWMNLAAPLPFVDEIFRLNHHAVMRNGLVGARRRLGVEGEYERVA